MSSFTQRLRERCAMVNSNRDDRLTETRLDPEGNPRLFSKMTKEERDSIASAMPPEFVRAVAGSLKLSKDCPEDPPSEPCK